MRDFKKGDMIKAIKDTDGGTPELYKGKRYKIRYLYRNSNEEIYAFNVEDDTGLNGGWTNEWFDIRDDLCGECSSNCRSDSGKCGLYQE